MRAALSCAPFVRSLRALTQPTMLHAINMMTNPDYYLYALHAGFWIAFGLTRLYVRARTNASAAAATDTPVASTNSRLVLAPHILAFGMMYYGIDAAVFRHLVPEWLAGQRILGAIIIIAGAALTMWALLYFRSWRFRATLDAGHELATGGPFYFLRHPIYMGLNLLAIGTAVWIPSPMLLAAAALMIIGSDIRARAEEHLLLAAFGRAYADYAARTKRFVPGIY